MTVLPVAIWEAWIRRAGSQELTKEEWAKTVHRLGGDEKDTYTDMRDLIRRSFADNELLKLWYASRDSDDPDITEIHKFTWDEMRRRAAQALAQTA